MAKSEARRRAGADDDRGGTKHARRRRTARSRRQDRDGKNYQAPEQPNTPIAIRTNFNPLAAFAPAVKTDADGKATVDIKLPDNLTRYRVVAIAVAGDKQFGKGESALTARLPLMVRPSPPRFLNFGDTFELPVVVQNQTDAPMTVRVAARTANVDADRRRGPRGHGAARTIASRCGSRRRR